MKKMKWIVFFLSVFASSWGVAGEKLSGFPRITEGQLANGFSYTLVPMAGYQHRVDIRLSVDAGSLDQLANEPAVAHMVEHMVFRGSRQYPQGVASLLQSQGWQRARQYNAMTNYERTLFMMSPPDGSAGIPLAMTALSQMTGSASITDADLNSERQIILEEWRGQLGVASRMNQQRVAALREGSRYPSRPPIGDEKSIRETGAEALRQFYQRWYRPGNMRLLIIGDFDVQQARKSITDAFQGMAAAPVSARNYYEPVLANQLRVVRLQDRQSGNSQVSLVTRFPSGPDTTLTQRLVSQVALQVLTRQLQTSGQDDQAPGSRIIVRKSAIGRESQALGLFVDVTPGQHQQGLIRLLRERERFLRYGADPADIAEERQAIREAATAMAARPAQRDFSGWVRELSVRWEQKQPFTDSQQRGKAILSLTDSITDAQVNQQITDWLMANDQLVQFGIPGSRTARLPDPPEVRRQMAQVAALPLSPYRRPPATVLPQLPAFTGAGSLNGLKIYPEQQTRQWTLSNGDTLVWLKTPLAKDRVYLSATSPSGFMMQGLDRWQSQLAGQMIKQSGPAGWGTADFGRWKKEHSVSLLITQQPDELQIDSVGTARDPENLLAINHQIQVNAGIDPQVRSESMMQLLRQQATRDQSDQQDRDLQIYRLRYKLPDTGAAADTDRLSRTENSEFLRQWQLTVRAPMTWYLVADDVPNLVPLAARYLATIPRGKLRRLTRELPASGYDDWVSETNAEPRATVNAWSFSSRRWSPEDAVRLNVAQNLATQALKVSLRDDALGVYRLRFSSTLNDRHQRIESALSFTTAPQRAGELWQRALQVFRQLPSQITPQQVEEQRRQFEKAEESRSGDIYSLQKRLILSYRHYHDPRYLTEVAGLAAAIQTDKVREMAELLVNPLNMKVFIGLPKPVTEDKGP
ncbi:M16 family metallopeptidase [Tatumella sp. JGM118]|uniref:M16 family metallopeptidase n=1 Tax=Tatumella sp. JGM118 TaxID=2799796 RepID=UPI001BAFDBC0|nr:pitrilysin family protein [Tatumella sp. JGM118]MBS0908413.1 insulinase family protein [Tatumella sp. JGM118]